MSAPHEQMRLIPKLVPEDVIARAHAEHPTIVASYCLFSGGNDSTVTAHRVRDHYEALVHIETGTAVPGVIDFVREFADWLGKPLLVYSTPLDEYRRIVLGSDKARAGGKPDLALGFPGPAMHGTCYTRLKERQVEQLMRDTKARLDAGRGDRVLLLTGLRRAESSRRKGRAEVTRKASQVWCNPLIDWTSRDMHEYRATHALPESDVAAILHRSGECNCGAFAVPGEREELQAIYPEWFNATILTLEAEAREAGVWAVWGSREGAPPIPSADEFMCSDCQLRIL